MSTASIIIIYRDGGKEERVSGHRKFHFSHLSPRKPLLSLWIFPRAFSKVCSIYSSNLVSLYIVPSWPFVLITFHSEPMCKRPYVLRLLSAQKESKTNRCQPGRSKYFAARARIANFDLYWSSIDRRIDIGVLL